MFRIAVTVKHAAVMRDMAQVDHLYMTPAASCCTVA